MHFQQEAPNGKGAGGCRRGHSALNDSLVFCCVFFLRGCMPDQTALLGLHPIFILKLHLQTKAVCLRD